MLQDELLLLISGSQVRALVHPPNPSFSGRKLRVTAALFASLACRLDVYRLK
jgi:hypothetical protein